MIHIQVEEAFASLVDTELLHSAAQATLEAEDCPEGELTLVITGDEAVRELNRAYRGMDTPTDVLSFGGTVPEFVTAPEASDYLGDVVVSYPRAEAQAAGHTVQAELALLAVHGVLHLLGYDHSQPDEQEAMWRRQATVLKRLELAHIQPAVDPPSATS
jgi:probable rRNA maturation factor